MPFFSVIIPLYNKENFIENTINSVLNQSFIDFELIIINDGSTDNSEAKIMQFKDARIRYYVKENEGVSIARNLGITTAQAEYITFIDADDYWYPNFLQEMFDTINRFSEQKVFSAAKEIETKKNIFPAQYSIKKKADCQIVNYFDASHKESIIWTSSAVFHKSVFKEAGVFDTEIKIGEDTDLWIRIGLKYPVVFNWTILARYIFDKQSVSRNHHYIFEEKSFLKYAIEEKENKSLKKFLDLNRFTVAIKNKLNDNPENFRKTFSQINHENLSLKKRILLHLPAPLLEILITIKVYLADIGLGKSVFK